MGGIKYENKLSNSCGNIYNGNVPFNEISSDEESNFIFHKKISKEPTIHYQTVP